jgi:hypothetical protein
MSSSGSNESTAPQEPRKLGLARAIAYILAAAAFAVSFRHVQTVATQHHQGGWVSWAIAVSVELMALGGFTETKSRREAGRGIATAVWPVLLGTAMSLGANLATAGPGFLGKVMAAWPSIAFISVAVMVELEPSGKGRIQQQTASALDIVRAETQALLAAIGACATDAVRASQERERAQGERLRAHAEELMAAVRAQADELTAAVRAQVGEVLGAVRAQSDGAARVVRAQAEESTATVRARMDDAVRTLEACAAGMETELQERLDGVEERAHTSSKDLVNEVRAAMDGVADLAALVISAAKETGSDLVVNMRAEVQQIAADSHRDGAALNDEIRQVMAEQGAKIADLTIYTELSEMADSERAAHNAAAQQALLTHVGDLARAAHGRTAVRAQTSASHTAVRAQAGAPLPAVRAQKAVRAVTSGTSRTPAMRTTDAVAVDSRPTREQFVAQLAEVMRADPEWVPDYDRLIEQTGFRIRWNQECVKEARELLDAENGGITDAEIVEEERV